MDRLALDVSEVMQLSGPTVIRKLQPLERTRKLFSGMRTSRLLTGPGRNPLEPDGTPLDLDRIPVQTQTHPPPPTQMELRLDKQTPVKTLPCPKLRLRTVIIL